MAATAEDGMADQLKEMRATAMQRHGGGPEERIGIR